MNKKDNPSSSKLIPLTFVNRIFMLACYVIQLVLFGIFQLLMIHYIYKPISFLFSAPSLVTSQYHQTSYAWNAFLYSTFFFQHVGMSLIIFKLSLKNIWYKYPLFQRYIYNISSSLAQIAIFYLARPVSNEKAVIFTTPYFMNMSINLFAVIILTLSIVKFGGGLLNPYSIKQIINNQYIQHQPYNQTVSQNLTSTGIYGFCRHPMQASIIVLLLFVSNTYTVDRIIFIIVNILGIFIGVYYQQIKLKIKFKGYKQYQQKVPYKFIPYVI